MKTELTKKEREECIDKAAKIAADTLNISYDQARKRVLKVEEMKPIFTKGIDTTKPLDVMEEWFIQVKIDQIMTTQID